MSDLSSSSWVFNLGSYQVSSGSSDSALPSVVLPSHNSVASVNGATVRRYFPDAIQPLDGGEIEFSFPVEPDHRHFDANVSLLRHISRLLHHRDIGSHPLVMVLPTRVCDNQPLIESCLHSAFSAGVRHVMMVSSPVARTIETGRISSLVATIGHEGSSFAAVKEGRRVLTSQERSSVCGRSISEAMKQTINDELMAACNAPNATEVPVEEDTATATAPPLPSTIASLPSAASLALRGGVLPVEAPKGLLYEHTMQSNFDPDVVVGESFRNFSIAMLIDEIKRTIGAVAPMTHDNTKDKEEMAPTFVLPDGKGLTLSRHAVSAPFETLFNGELPFTKQLCNFRKSLPDELRSTLPVLFSGATARTPGFDQRMYAELKKTDASFHTMQLSFHREAHEAFRGGAMLGACPPQCADLFVTKKTLEEEGIERVFANCIA